MSNVIGISEYSKRDLYNMVKALEISSQKSPARVPHPEAFLYPNKIYQEVRRVWSTTIAQVFLQLLVKKKILDLLRRLVDSRYQLLPGTEEGCKGGWAK